MLHELVLQKCSQRTPVGFGEMVSRAGEASNRELRVPVFDYDRCPAKKTLAFTPVSCVLVDVRRPKPPKGLLALTAYPVRGRRSDVVRCILLVSRVSFPERMWQIYVDDSAVLPCFAGFVGLAGTRRCG